jgi:hypothetical protein
MDSCKRTSRVGNRGHPQRNQLRVGKGICDSSLQSFAMYARCIKEGDPGGATSYRQWPTSHRTLFEYVHPKSTGISSQQGPLLYDATPTLATR